MSSRFPQSREVPPHSCGHSRHVARTLATESSLPGEDSTGQVWDELARLWVTGQSRPLAGTGHSTQPGPNQFRPVPCVEVPFTAVAHRTARSLAPDQTGTSQDWSQTRLAQDKRGRPAHHGAGVASPCSRSPAGLSGGWSGGRVPLRKMRDCGKKWSARSPRTAYDVCQSGLPGRVLSRLNPQRPPRDG